MASSENEEGLDQKPEEEAWERAEESEGKSRVNRAALVNFFKFHLRLLPEPYTVLETSRTSVIYFCVVGLDLLGELDCLGPLRDEIIDYVYSQQLTPPKGSTGGHRGFLGTFKGQPFGSCLCDLTTCQPVGQDRATHDTETITVAGDSICKMEGHLAMSYTTLAVLKTLDDDFSRVDKKSLVEGIIRTNEM